MSARSFNAYHDSATAAGQAEVGNANDVATVTQVPAASHVTKLREIQVTYDMLSNGTASR